MEESKTKIEQSNQDFNSEPVVYCSHCLSLAVLTVNDTDFCDKCGCTEMASADIADWEELYKQKYGENFLIRK